MNPRGRSVMLGSEQLNRAEAAQARQDKVLQLARMNHRELAALLGGDPAAAAPWVQSAAECGIAAAQVRLGRMLLEGRGMGKDPASAFRWFVRAAEQRDADAMNMVGRCYEHGWGTAVELGAAAHWYRWSAARGRDWGQYNFANMLFDGRGVAIDRTGALLWYLRAARQGHSRAMNLIGRCYEEGWGCAQNRDIAFEWYRRSAEAGYFRGQFNYAASLAERGLAAQAAEWSRRAAAGGMDACALARLDRQLERLRDRKERAGLTRREAPALSSSHFPEPWRVLVQSRSKHRQE
jgi:uncharacterized protein